MPNKIKYSFYSNESVNLLTGWLVKLVLQNFMVNQWFIKIFIRVWDKSIWAWLMLPYCIESKLIYSPFFFIYKQKEVLFTGLESRITCLQYKGKIKFRIYFWMVLSLIWHWLKCICIIYGKLTTLWVWKEKSKLTIWHRQALKAFVNFYSSDHLRTC